MINSRLVLGFVLMGLLFSTGGEILIGWGINQWVDSNTFKTVDQIMRIPVPQSIALFRVCLIAALIWSIPSWMVAKTTRWVMNRLKQTHAGAVLIKRIRDAG